MYVCTEFCNSCSTTYPRITKGPTMHLHRIIQWRGRWVAYFTELAHLTNSAHPFTIGKQAYIGYRCQRRAGWTRIAPEGTPWTQETIWRLAKISNKCNERLRYDSKRMSRRYFDRTNYPLIPWKQLIHRTDGLRSPRMYTNSLVCYQKFTWGRFWLPDMDFYVVHITGTRHQAANTKPWRLPHGRTKHQIVKLYWLC